MKPFLALAGLLVSSVPISIAQKNETDEGIDLSMLGTPSWSRLRPGWSLTVNDQCLYEFVFQFEHDESLPIGRRNFEEDCVFKDPVTKKPHVADDGLPYLEPRKFWERFPDYVWATIGFQHMTIEWYPCGHRPRGYAAPQYGLSFFRVTPEFRALAMTCDLLNDEQVVVPGEDLCSYEQETVNGMKFNIVPSHVLNRNAVANMPEHFRRPVLGNGPVPHVGQRLWDQESIPETPNRWEDTPVFMSSYAGDLVMWHAKVPYTRVSGGANKFTSNNYRYFQPTVDTLPDTHAFHYDASEGVIRFHMVGKSGLCRGAFESAQAVAGGAPTFPNWGDVFGDNQDDGGGNIDGDPTGGGSGSGNGNGNNGSEAFRTNSVTVSVVASITLIALGMSL